MYQGIIVVKRLVYWDRVKHLMESIEMNEHHDFVYIIYNRVFKHFFLDGEFYLLVPLGDSDSLSVQRLSRTEV